MKANPEIKLNRKKDNNQCSSKPSISNPRFGYDISIAKNGPDFGKLASSVFENKVEKLLLVILESNGSNFSVTMIFFFTTSSANLKLTQYLSCSYGLASSDNQSNWF